MTSGRILVVVERAHRGTLEEQYAHVLWLVRTLRRLSALTLLLRGTAAVYAIDRVPDPHDDYRTTMLSLARQDTELLVSVTSLGELGLGECPLLPGVQALSDREVIAQWAAHDRIWFL